MTTTCRQPDTRECECECVRRKRKKEGVVVLLRACPLSRPPENICRLT